MEWQVTLTAQLHAVPDEELLGILVDELADYGGAVGGPTVTEPHSLSVTLTINAPDAPDAAVRAAMDALVVALTAAHGPPVAEWISGEAITAAEADRRLEAATIPPLVSGPEAAKILGVARQRVHQLAAEHPDFPAPAARLAVGSVWLRAAVEGFEQRWQRRPGRPRKASSR